ncbi:hypothetical protein BC832DRAFT_549374 [Gaertneriomyces semiglobifer]|nr:hypothetical protein BC832DRAFT_549374 [Gaertneriomyces semiglobifer]
MVTVANCGTSTQCKFAVYNSTVAAYMKKLCGVFSPQSDGTGIRPQGLSRRVCEHPQGEKHFRSRMWPQEKGTHSAKHCETVKRILTMVAQVEDAQSVEAPVVVMIIVCLLLACVRFCCWYLFVCLCVLFF